MYATTQERLKNMAIAVLIAAFSLIIVTNASAKTNVHFKGRTCVKNLNHKPNQSKWVPSFKGDKKGTMLSWQVRKFSSRHFRIR